DEERELSPEQRVDREMHDRELQQPTVGVGDRPSTGGQRSGLTAALGRGDPQRGVVQPLTDVEHDQRREHTDQEHVSPRLRPEGPTTSQITDADNMPTPATDCRAAHARPRAEAGHSSQTIAAPGPHSPPSPRPVMKRKTTSIQYVCANAVRPVKS